MPSNFRLILAAPPAQLPAVLTFGLPVAHMAYRIGADLRLLRTAIPASVRGGLMMVDDAEFDDRGDITQFCRELLHECAAHSFDGVILDLEHAPSPMLGRLVAELAGHTAKRGWPLYVPEAYASFSDKTSILISSALSGGSLTQRLTEAAAQYGAGRIALGVERVAEDFYLPSPSGQGTPLSRQALAKRILERSPSLFFSNELCARYFTYMSKQSGAHFVLFDDADSIRRKLSIARKLKLQGAVLAYPQVDDLLPTILA